MSVFWRVKGHNICSDIRSKFANVMRKRYNSGQAVLMFGLLKPRGYAFAVSNTTNLMMIMIMMMTMMTMRMMQSHMDVDDAR